VSPSDPVFPKVGVIVSTKIDSNGYSTSSPFIDAPFGGTLDIFGNLTKFWGWTARSYRLDVDKDGGGFKPVTAAWTVQWWNPLTSEFEAKTVAPDPGTGRYDIPLEYGPVNAPYRWQYPYLAARWPSSADGLYTFRFALFDGAAANPAASPVNNIPSNEKNLLTLRVDNSAPEVDLEAIVQLVPPATNVAACTIVSSGPSSPNSFQFRITARDPNHHMLDYNLSALWGKNGSNPHVADDTYIPAHQGPEGPYAWSGVAHVLVPSGGWSAACNCAHTFILGARKRTTNGYHYVLSASSHQSITINNTGNACP
jgi:hypothetical protein